MAKDLTTSDIHRKNILNNRYALQEIEKEVGFPGILFVGSLRDTQKYISESFYGKDRHVPTMQVDVNDIGVLNKYDGSDTGVVTIDFNVTDMDVANIKINFKNKMLP